jgi:hypothetical protein
MTEERMAEVQARLDAIPPIEWVARGAPVRVGSGAVVGIEVYHGQWTRALKFAPGKESFDLGEFIEKAIDDVRDALDALRRVNELIAATPDDTPIPKWKIACAVDGSGSLPAAWTWERIIAHEGQARSVGAPERRDHPTDPA